MNKTNCKHCNKEFNPLRKRKLNIKYKDKVYSYFYTEKKRNNFCSQECYHQSTKGKKLSGERLKVAQITVKKAIDARKNNPIIREKWIKKMKEVTFGEKNHRWIEDRSSIVNWGTRRSYEYMGWARKVRVRDGYKCRIDNEDCCGKIEVHHILPYRDYPELHYQINNGITLCHALHPRVRSEEKRLIPTFQELVSVSND